MGTVGTLRHRSLAKTYTWVRTEKEPDMVLYASSEIFRTKDFGHGLVRISTRIEIGRSKLWELPSL